MKTYIIKTGGRKWVINANSVDSAIKDVIETSWLKGDFDLGQLVSILEMGKSEDDELFMATLNCLEKYGYKDYFKMKED